MFQMTALKKFPMTKSIAPLIVISTIAMAGSTISIPSAQAIEATQPSPTVPESAPSQAPRPVKVVIPETTTTTAGESSRQESQRIRFIGTIVTGAICAAIIQFKRKRG